VFPLEGILVVSLEQAVAAPFCTRQLADQGARVIKVERPQGGDFARSYDQRANGMSSHFIWANRSKESVALDLKDPDDLEALRVLIGQADIFVQNLAPGAARRMGLDYETLSAGNPRLILCDISGYGAGGPDQDRKAYDLLIQAESGFLSITGTQDQPAKAGCSIADIAAGMYAYSNILSALFGRERTGAGRHIDISMLEAMVEWMGFPLYYALDGASPPERVGSGHATIFPYGPFPTADGDIILAVQNDREWAAFCALVLDAPALAEDPRFDTNMLRSANRDALSGIIRQSIGGLPRADVEKRLDDARIAHAPLNAMADIWSHPQLRARDRWTSVDTPIGALPSLLPPGQSVACMKPVPALGEHTDAILREFGLR